MILKATQPLNVHEVNQLYESVSKDLREHRSNVSLGMFIALGHLVNAMREAGSNHILLTATVLEGEELERWRSSIGGTA